LDGTCWGALAEHVAQLHKGDRVLVHGTTYDEEWTDREGGTRVRHVIQVSAVGASLRYTTVTVHRANTKNWPVDEATPTRNRRGSSSAPRSSAWTGVHPPSSQPSWMPRRRGR
jgi:single-stranded DNA-binding protein